MRLRELFLSSIVGLTGCATIMTDDHQAIAVETDPPGARCQVFQGGVPIGVIDATPGTVYLAKGRHDVTIGCDRYGYFPKAVAVQPHFQDWTVGNILYGGSLGVLVDASSGAINEYPHTVTVLMNRQPRVGEKVADTERLSQLEAARHHRIRYDVRSDD